MLFAFSCVFWGGVGWSLSGLGVSGGVLKFVFVFLKSEKHISFVAICFCLWKHQRAGDCGGAFWGIVVCGKSARHPGENAFLFQKVAAALRRERDFCINEQSRLRLDA
jgi:hypothetical protein